MTKNMAALNRITMEIPIFLCFVSFLLTGPVLTNLIMYRTCYVTMKFGKTECAKLGNNNDTQILEKMVQPQADLIIMTKSIIDPIIPIFFCMLAGPWSDKHGRKPVLLLTLTGMACSCILMVVFSLLENISPWYILITSVPTMLTGAQITFFAITLSYFSDISTAETRALRMVIYEVILLSGVMVGSISSSYIFYATNYATTFGIGAGCMIINCLYVIFCIPESLPRPKYNIKNFKKELAKEVGQKNISLVSEFLADLFKTAFKRRANYTRALILLIIMSMIIKSFATNGDSSVHFIFLRAKLNWTLTKYNLFTSGYHACSAIGLLCGTFILKEKLKIRESILALVGLTSLLSCVILQLLATSDIFIYIAGVTKCLGGLVAPMLRSQISRLVPANEVGKIFSLVVGGGALIALGATPLYTAIYNATINIDAAFFNFLTIGLLGITVVFVLTGVILENKSSSSTSKNEDKIVINSEPVKI